MYTPPLKYIETESLVTSGYLGKEISTSYSFLPNPAISKGKIISPYFIKIGKNKLLT
jgi:hypothetical protein